MILCDVVNNKMIDEFLDNRLWIHITSEDFPLIDQLSEMIPGLKFRSGIKVNTANMLKFSPSDEIWIRKENGVSFCRTYPRTSGLEGLSPWIYKFGPIVDIKEFLNIKEIEIDEDELIKMIME